MATTDARRRRLGTVVDVNAERFRVEMTEAADGYTLVGFDDQHYVARIGSLVLIPLTNVYVVAEVTGLQERPDGGSVSSASKSMEDITQVSSRQLSLTPLGSLPFDETESFSFGVSEFPPLYADVLHVENRDLDRILNVANQEISIPNSSPEATKLRSLTIGTSVVFNDYEVKIRINEFFGAHSAILGNTGSGKSCTIASLLQASLGKPTQAPAGGSTFILFDTNGEYRRALSELPAPIRRTYARISHRRAVTVDPVGESVEGEVSQEFQLPHWLLTPEEWELLLQTSDRVQRPVLRNALGLTSLFAEDSASELKDLKNHILASCLQHLLRDTENHTSAKHRMRSLLNVYGSDEISVNGVLHNKQVRYGLFDDRDIAEIEETLKSYLLQDAEIPGYRQQPFSFSDLETALDMAILYEESHGNSRVRDYCSTLLTRVKALQSRDEFEFLRADPGQDLICDSRENIVDNLLGLSRDGTQLVKRGQVFILDLSTVDDEVVEVVSSVVTRLVFDRLRRSSTRNAYPVNLVLEEAHRYVPSQPKSASTLDATKIFERVAKEGRKYGLFLIISSQRPSELSGTVLSQCSNYMIHRIQNPEDLQHIRRMTPFISETVLNRLASLPKQHALVFGTSVSIPTTCKIRTAFPLPHSDDSDVSTFWYRAPDEVTGIPA
ncbi:Nucleotidyltransferase [Arthrobacter sp. 9V]|uniref:ATP-binding protein n=1 Tax=Arthrobacter sp. 9V TaxID=2653132 RepID=UPI0012F44470|nr:ATP-binding protein [Arthrobacter sp. 9V]VXB57257.1 Nucleotidyltransferase [Arthrobacter sp. 9V]